MHTSQPHTHHPGCSHSHNPHQIPPQQYFQHLTSLKQTSIQFYWMQILKGAVLAKYLEKYRLGWVNSLNGQILRGVVGMVHMMLTFQWVPVVVRPFVSGLFWVLGLYVFLNYKVITGFGSQSGSQSGDGSGDGNVAKQQRQATMFIIYLPIILYILVALRTSGRIKTQQNKKIAQKILQTRPYLQSPNFQCRACELPKAFRSGHCPICQSCIPKFSRHSLVFGVCIGAANQLLAILFFLSMVVFSGYCLYKVVVLGGLYGVLTRVMVYFMNVAVLWMSVAQFCTFLVLNIRYGVTQYEIQNWQMLQYLMKAPMRQFQNSCNNGIFHNLTQSVFALLGASGFEAELYNDNDSTSKKIQQKQKQLLRQQVQASTQNTIVQKSGLQFPQIKQGMKYIVNWDKAYIVVIPQMPNNPRRAQIQQIMKTQQPKMIANYNLLKKFKKQTKQQNPQFNQFQIQQRAMMKMNEHIMKNPQAMQSMMKPPPEQQKAIQLQMLGHMKMQFKSSEPEIYAEFEGIEGRLRGGVIGPEEATMAIRGVQQRVMEKKMRQIMEEQKRQQEQSGAKKQQQNVSSANQSTSKIIQPGTNSIQAMLQAQLMQRLQQRSKEVKQVKQVAEQKEKEAKGGQMEKKQREKNKEKEEQSEKLRENQGSFVDDQNL